MKRATRFIGSLTTKGIIKRQQCSHKDCKKIGQAHHWNYNKEYWIDIQWLCPMHHKRWHAENKAVYPDDKTIKKLINGKGTSVILTFNEKTQKASEWAKELNIEAKVIYSRLHLGWSPEKTLSTPVKKILNKKSLSDKGV